jgi:hypothetical protein
MTTIDEDDLAARLADATTRLYSKSTDGDRLWQLGDLVKPTVKQFYQAWYDVPVNPAYTYNAASVPSVGGTES